MITEKETLKVRVGKVTRSLDDNEDLNTQKDAISDLMKEVEFILGSDEETAMESFSDVIIAMANFDFSQRVKTDESFSGLAKSLATSLNMLCEEFENTAVQRRVMQNILSATVSNADLLVLTDISGKITMVNCYGNKLSFADEKTLIGFGVNVLFENFEVIDTILKEGDSWKEISVQLKWKGKTYPATLNLSISSHMGKMEAMIYTVKLQD